MDRRRTVGSVEDGAFVQMLVLTGPAESLTVSDLMAGTLGDLDDVYGGTPDRERG